MVSSIGVGVATLGWHLSPSPSSPSSLSTSLVLPERRSMAPLVVPTPVLPQPQPPGKAGSESDRSEATAVFSDVSPQHWIYPILQNLGQRQRLKGFPDGLFRPEEGMTRAELTTQLAQLNITNLAHVSSSSTGQAISNPSYRDVDPQHWAYRPIQSVVQTSYMAGYPDGSFRPDQPLTRLQVVLSLSQGLGLKSQNSPTQVLQSYEDHQQVPDWGAQALAASLEAGLVIGEPESNKLEPNRLATRAEVISMIHAVLIYTGQIKPLPSP
ncbi:MAG: S-layer homology domain-containing protein [Nodosilinea sp.]